jgi:3alpha(or 20beta)-hydroxysteroid dehydrogenase
MGHLSGKVACITGAARGQGAAIARRLAADGAKVVLTDLNDDGINVAQSIGVDAAFVRHDVTSKASWDAVILTTIRRYERLDILINNAGVFLPKPIQETDEELFDRHFSVNARGAFLGIQAVIDPMKKSGGGVIVNTSSTAGLKGYPGMFAYGTSKWALRGLGRCAATDLAPFGIRVNTVFPGLIDTPMIVGNGLEANQGYVDATLLKRIGTPEEIAALMAYLVSDEARYITGAEFLIDGGMSC